MPKSCSLIATIPTMNDLLKVKRIISDPHVSEVRWNTGIVTPYSETETLEMLLDLSVGFGKKLWVDVKGRQLRVEQWGCPLYSTIKLNHDVEVEGSANVILRGEQPLRLIAANGNEIFVNPLPKHAVGAGQSVNIVPADEHSKVTIKGYLTDKDVSYLEACKKLGIDNIMASYVESKKDLKDIKDIVGKCNIVCKIESVKGVTALFELSKYDLMAARDDLYIELNNDPYHMQAVLDGIIKANPNAIYASRIFSSLEHSSNIAFSDFADMELGYAAGYRRFMLCDNICNYSFDKAIEGWERFINHEK